MRNICAIYAQRVHHSLVTCRTQVSSVKCQVDAIGNVQRSMFSFVPIDRLLVSRDYPSSCLFISNFRAHAHYSISISIDFTLNTWQSDGGYWLWVIGYTSASLARFVVPSRGTDLVRMLTSPPRRQDGLARQKSHAIKTRSPPSSSHKFVNLRDPFIFVREMQTIVVPSDAALCFY
jgi:hypothetical protein